MNNLDRAIAAQSETLRYRRYWIRQSKRELGNDALNFCRKPTTLAGAFITGSVLALIYPPRRRDKSTRPNVGSPTFLQRYFATSLQLLLVNAMRRLFSPTATDQTRNDIQGVPVVVESLS